MKTAALFLPVFVHCLGSCANIPSQPEGVTLYLEAPGPPLGGEVQVSESEDQARAIPELENEIADHDRQLGELKRKLMVIVQSLPECGNGIEEWLTQTYSRRAELEATAPDSDELSVINRSLEAFERDSKRIEAKVLEMDGLMTSMLTIERSRATLVAELDELRGRTSR